MRVLDGYMVVKAVGVSDIIETKTEYNNIHGVLSTVYTEEKDARDITEYLNATCGAQTYKIKCCKMCIDE